jgi:hypothetical protein
MERRIGKLGVPVPIHGYDGHFDERSYDRKRKAARQGKRATKGGWTMAYDVPQLLKMSQAELDKVFKNSPPGDIPDGDAKGTAIIAPGTRYNPEIAEFISHLAWQGKVFDAKNGVLRNKILPFGLHAVSAKVYKQASWLDGKACIVLDYSQTSLIARWIRDEIRLIGPGLYLGKAYWSKQRLIDFALQF